MKKGIHPEMKKCTITCACGNSFETMSTVDSQFVEVCCACHPFYTGEQGKHKKTGTVEKFNKKYNLN